MKNYTFQLVKIAALWLLMLGTTLIPVFCQTGLQAPNITITTPCQAGLLSDETQTGFMLKAEFFLPGRINGKEIRQAYWSYQIAKDTLFIPRSFNLLANKGELLYDNQGCFDSFPLQQGRDTVITRGTLITRLWLEQLFRIGFDIRRTLVRDSSYYIRASIIATLVDGTVIESPKTLLKIKIAHKPYDAIAFDSVTATSMKILAYPSFLGNDFQPIRPDTIRIEVDTDSLFTSSNKRLLAISVPRIINDDLYVTINDFKPNTRYFVRLRQFALGNPIREYSKSYAQSTLSSSAKNYYIHSNIVYFEGVIYSTNNESDNNRICSNVFQYNSATKITIAQADSLFAMLLDSGKADQAYGNVIFFEDNSEQTKFIVHVFSNRGILSEEGVERMRRFGFLRQSIDWSGVCSLKFLRSYRVILQRTSVLNPAHINNVDCNILTNPVSNEINVQIFSSLSTHCHIKLFDMRGTQVMTVFDGIIEKGELSLSTKTTGIPSGQYVLVLQTPTERIHRLLTVVH